MSVLIFHWTISKSMHPGVNNPHARKRILSRWNLMAKAFGIDTLFCVTNDPNIQMHDTEIVSKIFNTLDSAVAEAEGELIYIEQGGEDIQDFSHPRNAAYIFGCDYGELKADRKISIKTKYPLHAEIAAGIVLSHRYQQWY